MESPFNNPEYRFFIGKAGDEGVTMRKLLESARWFRNKQVDQLSRKGLRPSASYAAAL
jgi:hypothetical protein